MSGFRSQATPRQPLTTGRSVRWLPQGFGGSANDSTYSEGYNTLTFVGTPTGRVAATTNLFTRQRRVGIVSASSSGSLASARTGGVQVSVGTGTVGVGGFYKVIRFGCSDAATVAGARQFVGVATSTSAPTNVEPSTLTNAIGVGHGAADTNLFICYGGSAAQTPIDLGANFPANTLSVDLYELVLSSPSTSPDVYYQVTRLNTGHVATGVITNSGATVLPAATTLMNYHWSYRTNNATALAVALDIISDCIEIDV